jgi:xylan 1,4-beta-xylosidase
MENNSKDILLKAIQNNDLDSVKTILTNDQSLIDAEGLFAAAKTGDLNLVKWLVEYSRISLNEYGYNHRNVLHYAAESCSPDSFVYLVEKCGMDPLEGDRDLVTPWDIIHEIMLHGTASVVNVLTDINNAPVTNELLDTVQESNIFTSKNASDNKTQSSSDGKVSNTGNSARPIENPPELRRRNASAIESYLEKRYGHKYTDFYRNPIRTGFFPDPSIVRVGSDYYMVNSSFIFFPCIPISHSKDLIHWEIIGHAITNPEWAHLDGLEGGRGYWAPDISYYEGMFYITATYRLNDVPPVYRRQIVVSSDKPEGPYSEPVFIDEDGIDPSIFNDDDGRRYMLLNRGARIFELDKTATKKISDATLLYYGDYKRAPEGPHLYKKDGYYYLLEAEGGTGPGHRVTVSRSKELFGNYEPCPYNPIMRQDDPDAAIQRCGHGDLVDTPDGRWYMVYLCGRMIGDGYSILGRETALDPVTWTADGWPVANNLKGPSAMQVKPFAESAGSAVKDSDHETSDNRQTDITKSCKSEEESGALQIHGSDRISPCGLFMDYMTPRPFETGAVTCRLEKEHLDQSACTESEEANISMEKEPAAIYRSFEIIGSRAPLDSVNSRNIVLRRQTAFRFRYEVTLDIPMTTGQGLKEGQCAGIIGYYDENTFFEFGITARNSGIYIYSREHIGDEDRIKVGSHVLPGSIRLRMDTDYLTRSLYYSYDQEDVHFTTLTNVNYLCDEGLRKGKRFTGALVGMYAYRGDDNLKVRFHHDLYQDLTGNDRRQSKT